MRREGRRTVGPRLRRFLDRTTGAAFVIHDSDRLINRRRAERKTSVTQPPARLGSLGLRDSTQVGADLSAQCDWPRLEVQTNRARPTCATVVRPRRGRRTEYTSQSIVEKNASAENPLRSPQSTRDQHRGATS